MTDTVLATITETRDVKLEIVGSLSLATATELRVWFESLATRGLASLTVDLSRTDVVMSVGISTLAIVWERATSQGVPVRFVGVSEQNMRLFEIAGVKQIFMRQDEEART
jgi:anti-anti-sigma factor